MPHWMLVFLYEAWRGFRRKGFLFTTFILPVLLIGIGLLLVVVNRPVANDTTGAAQVAEVVDDFTPDADARYGVVDTAGVLAGDNSSLPAAITVYADETAARAGLEAGEVVAYYRIEADYLATGTVTLVQPELNVGNLMTAPVRGILLNALGGQARAAGLDEATAVRLQDPARYTVTNLETRSAAPLAADDDSAEDASFLVIYVFSVVFLLALFITNGYLLQSVIEEKETRLIEILIASMRPFHLIAGKILAYGLLGLVQVVTWLLIGVAAAQFVAGAQLQEAATFFGSLANLSIPTWVLGMMVIYFVLGYLLFAGLYGVIGAISNSMKEGPQYAVLFTLPAVAPMYFLPIFVDQPNGALPTFFSLFPLTAPIAMIERLLLAEVPAWQVGLSIGLLIAAVVGAMWLAGRAFRVQTLLAGGAPKLRDLPRLLRG